jgi:aspartate aminotransferase-like enzyme
MPGLRSDVDPDGLVEYSVVYTDRSLNHMSAEFGAVVRDIHETLCEVHRCVRAVIVPGGGTFAMEAVARRFASNAKVLVIRNGFFSYRWTQIFEAMKPGVQEAVLMARPVADAPHAPFAPPPVQEVIEHIRTGRPDLVFAPHVETASGMILSDAYLRAIAEAVHSVGGLFVLDGVASGCVWVDMEATGVDVLISAPQKNWSSTPCAGLVMIREEALKRLREQTSSSFALDLGRWLDVMERYLAGGHAYHATMPTDGLRTLRSAMAEARAIGFSRLQDAQWEQGQAVRRMLAERSVQSVAAEGFGAPGVVVCFTDDPDVQNGVKFADQGLQIAAGVPLMVGERSDYRSFRLGLFGLDKLTNIQASLARLGAAFDQVFQKSL